MIRVKNIDKSLDFYCNKLGLKEMKRKESEKGRYTLIFLGAENSDERHALLELTHNWDPEKYTGLCSYFAEEYSKKALGLANQLEE